ncbi:MAG: hypothetical protein FWF51_11015 [Chitinivibrionia bacterium]|nr:hypothetical protein [Chitinivibrionia bacterium]
MEEGLEKNEAGQYLALSDKKKRAMSEYLDNMAKYEISLHPLGDNAKFFVDKQMDKVKVEAVPIEYAKVTLKSLASHFDEKKKPLEIALEKVKKETATMQDMIAELDPRKFAHRIETIQEAIDKFKPHIEQLTILIDALEKSKMEKLAKAKEVIMRGHRKDYFEDYS